MKFIFEKPNNQNNTGIFFLKRSLYHYSDNVQYKKFSFIHFFRRKISKKNDTKYIFFPLDYKSFFSKHIDLVIFPDDSLRAIKSISKVRWRNKNYLKYLYQIFRYYYIFCLIYSLKNNLILIVSNDDVKSLRKRFPKHNIQYFHHPIQNQLMKVEPCVFSHVIKKVAFLNLQEHYCNDPKHFFKDFNVILTKELNDIQFYFHGSGRKPWINTALNFLNSSNCFNVDYIEDFINFNKNIDIVIMPLSAGAGVKNILLNSIYLNKVVFGSEEAFSGIPSKLADNFIISNANELINKLQYLNDIKKDYLELRNYVLEHHDISMFKSDLKRFVGECNEQDCN